jgi:serine/threonine protein kinase
LDAERWQRLRVLFDQIVEAAPEERRDLLEQECRARGFDAQMQSELLAMLRADATPTGDSGRLWQAAPDLIRELDEESVARERDALLGTRIGPWTLQRALGSGGMGVVYLVERTDGDFTQRAALKLIRSGRADDELRQRFRSERRILAALAHPGIAGLLDGGESGRGDPYLVMEYVDGTTISAHCDAQRLDLNARLRLFLEAARAVAHAHHRLVVHRDLKPSNILVDRNGRVKLLDFGIAKLLESDGSRTRTGGQLFTPEFAAPEQVRGEAVTTSVDIHALGLLLYVLLTGRRAYAQTGSTPAGYEHAVLSQDPTRPSQIAGADDADALQLAQLRHLSPARLRSQLRGDLDAIVMKALRKEPSERYPTAEAMIEDVERHLRREPVLARRGSLRYRARRFVQRHALAVALSGLALASLAGGLGVALWQFDTARHERDVARRQSLTAERTVDFLNGLFARADPYESAGESVLAVDLLEQGARSIDIELAAEPAVRVRLLTALGDSFAGLDMNPRSLELLEAALAPARELDDPVLLGRVLLSLATARGRAGDAAGEVALIEEAMALVLPADAVGRMLRARIEFHLANDLSSRSEHAEAERWFVSALDTMRQVNGRVDPEYTIAYSSLLHSLGRAGESEVLLRDALATTIRETPENHPGRAVLTGQLGINMMRQGRVEEGITMTRQALAAKIAGFGEHHRSTEVTRHNLAHALGGAGRWEEAEALHRDNLSNAVARGDVDSMRIAGTQAALARVLLDSGRAQESLSLWQDARRIVARETGERGILYGITSQGLGRALLALGNHDAADTTLQAAETAFRGAGNAGRGGATRSLVERIRVQLARGDAAPACEALAQALQAMPPGDFEHGYAQVTLGACRRTLQDAGAGTDIAAGIATLRATRSELWPERIWGEAVARY